MIAELERPFILKVPKGEVFFRNPRLNDRKELVFLSCDQMPIAGLEFVLKDEGKEIEIRHFGKLKAVIFVDERFHEQASNARRKIIELIKSYAHALQTGKEKVLVLETGRDDLPYYFMTHSMIEYGRYSEKFVKGFIYYLNKGLHLSFANFTEVQSYLAERFRVEDRYRIEEGCFELPFDELINMVQERSEYVAASNF